MRVFGHQNIFSIGGNEKDNCMSTLHYRNVQCMFDNEGQISGSFSLFPDIFTMRELFDHLVDSYYDRPLYGSFNEETKEYEFTTYGDFSLLVKKVTSSLFSLGITQETIVGVFIENSEWFSLMQWSLHYLGAIFFPIEVGNPLTITYNIIDVYKCTIICCSAYTFPQLFNLLLSEQPSHLKTIILACDQEEFEDLQRDYDSQLHSIFSIPIITVPSFLETKKQDLSKLPQQFATSPLVYNVTNGRAGSINVCILTNSNIIAASAGLASCGYDFTHAIYYSGISQVKPVERSIELMIMVHGGCIGFSTKEASQALKELSPTIAGLSPTLIAQLVESLINEAYGQNPLKRMFLDFGFSVAAQCAESYSSIPWFFQETLVKPFQELAGSRLSLIISAGELLEPRFVHTLRTMLVAPVIQIYGTAETGGVISVTRVDDQSCTSLGAPSLSCEIKLRDFSEGNMNVGSNEPGEIMVRGPNVFTGYLRNRTLTSKKLLEGGWFATGDLGRIKPNGTLEIVDTISDWRRRRSNN